MSDHTDNQLSHSKSTIRSRIGAFLAPFLFLLVWISPLPLEGSAHKLASIAIAVVVAWITEVIPIPVTALLIAPLMVGAGITDAKTAFSPYADPLLFLFYGSFFIASAMSLHGLDRRLANKLVTSPFISGVPSRLRFGMMIAGMMLSMWISNTASTAILMPILLGTVSGGVSKRNGSVNDRAIMGSLLAIAYACSVGGMGTLVGTPPNLITVRLLKESGIELDFLDWTKVGFPTALLITITLYVVFFRIFPVSKLAEASGSTSFIQGESGPWTRGEKVTALAFSIAVVGWITPGIFKALSSPLAVPLSRALPAGAVAICASSILFIFRDEKNGKAVLPWSEARKIDWGLIMLFGGGISLGSQMFATGLARELGRGFLLLTGVQSLWTLTALTILFTIFFTEVCSNTATSNMLVPLVIGISSELGISPVPPSLAVGIAASCAFMMPIATGPNAIVYGTERIALPTMVRVGFLLNLICTMIIFCILRILCPIFGWD